MTVASGLEVHDEQVKMICLELDVLSHGVMLLRCVQYAASRGAGETLSSAGTQSRSRRPAAIVSAANVRAFVPGARV